MAESSTGYVVATGIAGFKGALDNFMEVGFIIQYEGWIAPL